MQRGVRPPEEMDRRRRRVRCGKSNRPSQRDVHSGWKIAGTVALDEQNNGSFANCYGVGAAKFPKIIRRPKKICASKWESLTSDDVNRRSVEAGPTKMLRR